MNKKRTVIGNPIVDELSNQCLSCHNGVVAKKVDSGLQFCFCPEDRANHPIGVDYEKARLTNEKLKPLDKTIKLFNGKIGCGTCHDPYSKNSKQLVVPNTGSALCLKCHIDY